ncbi:MAG: hypothetical protein ACOC3V_02595 [bacterium]
MPVQFPRSIVLEYIMKYITDDIDERYEPWININSVFTSDNKHKLGFNPDENRVYDFKLGQGWTIPGFIKEYDDTIRTESEAQALLLRIFMKQKKSGEKIIFGPKKPKIEQPIDLPPLKTIYPTTKSLAEEQVLRNKMGRRAIRFIMSKNLGLKHVKKYNLQYTDSFTCWNCNGEGELDGEDCPICDRGSGKNPYYGFLIIPTYEKGNLVYFQARNTDKTSSFRYRNPPMPRTQVVYFYDQLKENDRILITEGPFDAMTLYDYSSTCVMGNRLSDPQILKSLELKPKEIIFVPDYDPDPNVRSRIFNTVKKNIDKVKFHLQDENIKIGTYEWYKKYKKKLIDGKKDINDLNLTILEEDLIKYELNGIRQISEKSLTR